jgi:diaminopimelate epimerase
LDKILAARTDFRYDTGMVTERIMHPLTGLPVTKMNGLGNVIVILDLRGSSVVLEAADVCAIDRGPGLAFDQLMVLHDPRTPGTEAFVRIYNNDGSEAGACGNGTRCVAWQLVHGREKDALVVETAAGLLACWRRGEWSFAVDMGVPRFAWQEIPLRTQVADTDAVPLVTPDQRSYVAAVASMGNPHAVVFTEALAAVDLETVGPALEHHEMFPQRANISFAEVRAPDHIVVNVWERGAGITQACGSAACAVLVTAVRRGLSDRKAVVSLPGGDLLIEWRDDDHVVMQGPVEWEFDTRLDAALFEGQAA